MSQRRIGKTIISTTYAKSIMMVKGEIDINSSKGGYILCKTNEDLKRAFDLSDHFMETNIIPMDKQSPIEKKWIKLWL